VQGRPASTPLGQDAAADLSVTKEVSSASVALGGSVSFTVKLSNAGPDTASEVELFDALPRHAPVADVTTTHGQCRSSSSGLQCDIGTLAPGDSASVTYVVSVRLPGTLANGATVFGKEGDPDLTNNSAFATVDLPVSDDDGRATPAGAHRGERRKHHKECGKLVDVNHDGRLDLVAHFRTDETGIALGDSQACVRGAFRDGRSLAGCDAILTRPKGKRDHEER